MLGNGKKTAKLEPSALCCTFLFYICRLKTLAKNVRFSFRAATCNVAKYNVVLCSGSLTFFI